MQYFRTYEQNDIFSVFTLAVVMSVKDMMADSFPD